MLICGILAVVAIAVATFGTTQGDVLLAVTGVAVLVSVIATLISISRGVAPIDRM